MRLAPMMRAVDILLLITLIAVVSWTFKVKHDSQFALERVADLERQIAAERVEIDLLKSDWSLLTSPARLQQLVERYQKELELESMEASQIANERELPAFKTQEIEPSHESHAGTDTSIKTGSITDILKRVDE
ncbi:MAG: cell division protein FtsL [Rhizobiaceae bacterium]